MSTSRDDKPSNREYLDVLGHPHTIPTDVAPIWRISGYAIVPGANGTILTVVPPWHPLYHLPGGGIEPGERLAEGVVRECLEETGYRIRLVSEKPVHFLEQDFYSQWHKKFYHALSYFFPGELVSDTQDISALNKTEVRETERVEWVPLKNIAPENTHRMFWPYLQSLL